MNAQPALPTLACNPGALTPAELREHQAVSARLFRKAGGAYELLNGLTFRFPNEMSTLSLIAQFIAGEQQCCAFLDFDVHVVPHRSILQLSLTGPENTTEFLQAEFAELLRNEGHDRI